jgi:hypothetical protein
MAKNGNKMDVMEIGFEVGWWMEQARIVLNDGLWY